MHFIHCPACGQKLTARVLGDEGAVPWCDDCDRPYFDMFSTCVICAVTNERREVALIQQDGVNGARYVCVAGYMKPGESAEDAARREIQEEIGQRAEGLRFMGSWPHRGGEQLMLGFRADVRRQDFALSSEVDHAAWIPYEQALSCIREGSIAWQLVKAAIEQDEEHTA